MSDAEINRLSLITHHSSLIESAIHRHITQGAAAQQLKPSVWQ